MFALSMACFALVLAVAALVGVSLTTLALRDFAKTLDSVMGRLALIENGKMPASLSAALDDLRAAYDTVSGNYRRQFGKLWQRIGGRDAAEWNAAAQFPVPATNGASHEADWHGPNNPDMK